MRSKYPALIHLPLSDELQASRCLNQEEAKGKGVLRHYLYSPAPQDRGMEG